MTTPTPPSAFELVRADEVPAAALHAAFTRTFSDYLIGPFTLPLEQWPSLLARQAIDLRLSRAACVAGEPLAFAFTAPRAATRWRLGTMGAVPAARGSGAAPALLDDFVARAVDAGVRVLELEAFAQNERAVRLYERHGFERVHPLHGWSRVAPAASDVEDPAVEAIGIDDAFAWLDETAEAIDDLPLQVTPRVLAVHRPVLRAWRQGEAQLVFADNAPAVASQDAGASPVVVHSLVDREPAQRDAAVLVAALLAAFPGRTVKVPALQRDDVGGYALARERFHREPLFQWLMRRDLPGAPG